MEMYCFANAVLKRLFLTSLLIFLGAENYGINFHYMEHIVDYVDMHGSLSENSLFYYESMNGIVRGLCNGTNRIGKTILRHLLAKQVLHRRLDQVDQPEQVMFIKRINNKRSVHIN